MKISICLLTLALSFFPSALKAEETETAMDRVRLADKKFETLFAAKRGVDPTDPEFMDILQNLIFGEVFYIGDLSDRERELITVTSLSAIQALPQLKAHIGAALNVGNAPVEIREAIYQCAPFIGFPKTLNAIGVFNQVMRDKGTELPLKKQGTVTEENRHAKGAEIQEKLYSTEVSEAMKTLPSEYREKVPGLLTDFAFGDFYTRNGLTVRQRELLSLVILASIGAEKQLSAHVAGNLKAGNSKETMLAAMVQTIPYIGFPRALSAINTVKNVDVENYEPIYGRK